MPELTNYWGEPNDRAHRVEGPCLTRTLNASMMGAAGGTFFAACKLAWYPDPVNLPSTGGAVKRFASTSSVASTSDPRAIARAIIRPSLRAASACAAFASVECLAEAVRGKRDSWNASIGGMAAGLVVGAVTKRADIMTSTAFGLGLFMFVLDYSGATTVHESVQTELREKMYNVLPPVHHETEALAQLKEKYPDTKEL